MTAARPFVRGPGKWLSDGGWCPEQAPPAPPRPAFQAASAFVQAYVPLAYVVEPIIRSHSIYTLTAATGAGKTALALIMASAVATGRKDLLGLDVEQGRVAYLAFENPDDLRMRLMVAAYLLNVDLAALGDRFVILDARAKPEALVDEIGAMTTTGGEFRLIVIDTFAAAFDGTDINNNVEGGEFVRRLRPLSQLPGLPAVVIPAHPVKNASADNLVPYGGGAILNEVDGNLCLTKRYETGGTTLHWMGKFRGLEFQPIHFRFEFVSSPDVVDNKGRQVMLPVLRPCGAEDVEQREQHELNIDIAILRCLNADPIPSVRDIAEQVGRGKSAVSAKLARLGQQKLTENLLGKWRLTPKGSQAIK